MRLRTIFAFFLILLGSGHSFAKTAFENQSVLFAQSLMVGVGSAVAQAAVTVSIPGRVAYGLAQGSAAKAAGAIVEKANIDTNKKAPH